MIDEPVISVAVHLLKGLIPASPCFRCRANDQLALLDFKIDRSVQVTLLNDGFRNPDTPEIADAHDARFHPPSYNNITSLRCHYIGITSPVERNRPNETAPSWLWSILTHLSL